MHRMTNEALHKGMEVQGGDCVVDGYNGALYYAKIGKMEEVVSLG